MKQHFYLSPHLDDAALSCGGLIALQTQRGEPVSVVTLFAGVPRLTEAEFSPYAQKQHAKWALKPQEVVQVRREEDRRALNLLSAQVIHWQYYDAIYRATANQEFLYTDHQKLFGPIHPDEQTLIEQLTDQIAQLCYPSSEVILYAPLQVGGHVDHLIARECAIRLLSRGAQVMFYEDFPYVGREAWKDEPTTVEKALVALPLRLKSQVFQIDTQLKIQANLSYQSQLFSLFGDSEGRGLAREILAYTRKVGQEAGYSEGHFERYWYPI